MSRQRAEIDLLCFLLAFLSYFHSSALFMSPLNKKYCFPYLLSLIISICSYSIHIIIGAERGRSSEIYDHLLHHDENNIYRKVDIVEQSTINVIGRITQVFLSFVII